MKKIINFIRMFIAEYLLRLVFIIAANNKEGEFLRVTIGLYSYRMLNDSLTDKEMLEKINNFKIK